MHAVFFSPVSWEWDTNMTTLGVVFVHQLLYNAGKKRENKGEKKIENKKKRAKQNELKKNIRSCFR